jgi:WD40 repeat protein
MTVFAPEEPQQRLTLRDRLRDRRQKRYADYDAFLSYSRVDAEFATQLQRGLERIMRPWNRVRSLKVFRDMSSLAAGSGLWTSIERALGRSSWLILLASPDAAASRWVNRELAWWLERKSPRQLLIVVTAGELVWDPGRGDFDPTAATAVPPALLGRLSEEPIWLDARWSRGAPPGDPRLRDVAGGLVATIKDVPRDEVFATDVREHRRTMRLARLAVVSLVLLLAATIAGGIVAYVQRNNAREQASLALSRQLAAVADSETSANLDVSLVLAVEAIKRNRNPQSTSALMTAALASPHLVRFYRLPANVTTLAGSADGRVIAAGLADGRVMRWPADSASPRQVAKLPGEVTEVRVAASGDAIVATDGSILTERSTAVLVRDGQAPHSLVVPEGQTASAVGISPTGRTVVVFGEPPVSGARRSVSVFDGRTGAVQRIYDTTDAPTSTHFIVPSDDEVVLFDPGYGLWDRRAIPSWKRIDGGNVAFGTQQLAGEPSADGEFMTATNGDPRIPIWRMHGQPENDRPDLVGVAPITIQGPLALSPDGGRLAVSDAGTIYVTETTEPEADAPMPTVLEGRGDVDQISFFGSGSRLLSSSGAEMALWDVSQLDRLARSARVPIRMGCVACAGPQMSLSPDDTSVAVIDGSGGSGAVVDLTTGESESLPEPELDFVYASPLWSEDGHAAFPVVPPAGGSEAELPAGLPATTRSWRAGEGSARIVTSGTTEDGRTGVFVDEHGKLYFQRLDDGAITRTVSLHPELELGSDFIEGAAVSPAGDRVATLLDDRVSIVDIPSGRTVMRFTAPTASYLVFARNRLFVQNDDGTLEVRGGAELRVERTLPGDGSYVWPPVPNGQGTLIARQRRNGDITLVDPHSGSTLAVVPPLRGSRGRKTGVAFSRDGRRLITITDEARYRAGATLVERDLSTATLIASACRAAGPALSTDEWRRFVGIEPPERPTCER